MLGYPPSCLPGETGQPAQVALNSSGQIAALEAATR